MSEQKRKLLLADDSVTIQKVVNLTFADEGIEVLAVGDGDAAMEKFVEFAPDLLMVDVNMPGMDGYRICEMIKQDEQTARIPVILLVGSFEPFDEERAYRVGADGYLTKPFQSIRQLVGKVTTLLDAANADVSNGAPNFNVAAVGAVVGKEESAQTFQNYDTDIYDAEIYAESDSSADGEDNAPRFDDADADDETIQTNQIGSLPADEAQRFSSAATAVSGDVDYSRASADEPFENSYQFETKENLTEETQSLTAEETSEANQNFDEYETDAPLDQSVAEAASAQDFSSENSTDDAAENSGESEAVSSAPPQNFAWDFDDLNLLELSSHSTNDAPEDLQQIEEETTESNESVAAPQAATNISPEMIEQIVARVVEQLSERVISQMTREVVPQMSDLIVKELTQKNQ